MTFHDLAVRPAHLGFAWRGKGRRPLIDPDCHPLVRRLFDEMAAQQVLRREFLRRHGAINHETLRRWFRNIQAPRLADLDDCFSILGYRLRVRRVRWPRPRHPKRWSPIVPTNAHPLVHAAARVANAIRLGVADLSARSGLRYSVISSWLHEGAVPQLATFLRLLDVIGCELAVEEEAAP